MKDPEIEIRIESWKKRFGEDVSVSVRYFDGSYYRTTLPQWFGETKKFLVGPCASVDDVLVELTRLTESHN